MAKGGKKGRNDVESSFVVIFAPPARKNSKRRKKEEREREKKKERKEGKEEGKEEREKEKGERVFLPGGVSHERSATIKRLRPR